MEAIEFYNYFKKCELHGIRIYAMTEYEANKGFLENKKSNLTISQYSVEALKLESLKNSKKLRICIETPEGKSIGKMIFYTETPNKEENVHSQILLLYKMKSEQL
jgi:hypothetical protein